MPILRDIIGRLEETVVGPNGNETVRFHGIFVGLPHVREGQVIQESLSKFRLRLAVDPGFCDQDRQVIHRRFEERLGKIDLTFEYVDAIERTERGKFRAVISNLQRVILPLLAMPAQLLGLKAIIAQLQLPLTLLLSLGLFLPE
jgi:phenylacetate-CoA ligase